MQRRPLGKRLLRAVASSLSLLPFLASRRKAKRLSLSLGEQEGPLVIVSFPKLPDGGTSQPARAFKGDFKSAFKAEDASLVEVDSADFGSTLFAAQPSGSFVAREASARGIDEPSAADAIFIMGETLKERLLNRLSSSMEAEGQGTVEMFPLHDPGSVVALEEHWVNDGAATFNQPLDSVCHYFGVDIALYFGLLQDLTISMVGLAVVGVALFVYQSYWANSVDNSPTVLFAIGATIWATLSLKSAKRNQATRALQWGASKPSPSHEAEGEQEEGKSPWAGLVQFALVTVPVMALCILSVFLFIFVVERIRAMTEVLLAMPLSSIFTLEPAGLTQPAGKMSGLWWLLGRLPPIFGPDAEVEVPPKHPTVSPSSHLLLLAGRGLHGSRQGLTDALFAPGAASAFNATALTTTGFAFLDNALSMADIRLSSGLLSTVVKLFLAPYLTESKADAWATTTVQDALPWHAGLLLAQLPTLLFVVGVLVFDAVNAVIASQLTAWEGHSSQDAFDSSLVGKKCLLTFVDNFSALLYIAFVRCDLKLLRETLLFLLGIKAVISNVQELALPLLKGEVALLVAKLTSKGPPVHGGAEDNGAVTAVTAAEQATGHRRLSTHDISAIAAEVGFTTTTTATTATATTPPDKNVAESAAGTGVEPATAPQPEPTPGERPAGGDDETHPAKSGAATSTSKPAGTSDKSAESAVLAASSSAQHRKEVAQMAEIVQAVLSPSKTAPLTSTLDTATSHLRDHLNSAQVEAVQPAYSVDDDLLELFVQFGHVMLFSSIFPLAPLLAVLNNVIEVHSDAYKVLHVHQRPMVTRRTASLGASWSFAFDMLGFVGLATNVGLVFVSLITDQGKLSKGGDDGASIEAEPAVGPSQRLQILLWCVALEHLVLLLKVLLDRKVPDTPPHAVAVTARKLPASEPAALPAPPDPPEHVADASSSSQAAHATAQ